MLRNDKQFAYKSNNSTSGDISVENVYSNQNTLSTPRDNHSPARDNHSPARDNHSPARDNHSPARDNHSPARDNHSPARDNHSPARDNHSPARDNHSPVDERIYQNATKPTGSVVSSYRGSKEDRGSREDVISGHSRSPGRSESSC